MLKDSYGYEWKNFFSFTKYFSFTLSALEWRKGVR